MNDRMSSKEVVWPPSEGEMARRIREHDWAATALGPIEGWPQSLRTAVEMMLATPQPARIGWGPDLCTLYNDSYAPKLGGRHPAALGQPFREVWPEIWEEYRPHVEATLAGQSLSFVDQPVALAGRPDRPISWFTFSWMPLRDEDDAVAGMFLTARETTEDVLARQQLRESEEKYRTLFEAIDEGFAIFDMIFDEAGQAVDFRYVETNTAFERQTGRRPRPGQTMREVFSEAQGMWLDLYATVARTGEAKRFIDFVEGLDRWYDVYVFSTGEPGQNRLAALFSDVTERRWAENALRESEAKLALVMDQVPIGVGVFDAKGRLTLKNPHLRTLIGDRIPSRDDRQGHLWEGFDTEGHPVAPQDYPGARALRGEDATTPVLFRRVEDGAEHWLRVSAVPLRDGSAIVGGITVVQDVTDELRAQSEHRALAERNREILESISDAFYAVDRDWRLTYANRKAEEWWGRRREDLLGKVFWDEFPQAVGSEAYQAHLQAAETREVVRTEAVSPVLGHWIDITIYPTLDGGLSVYFRDISEKKRAEAALRESEARAKLLLAELQHRVRNTLGVVRSIARRTAETSESVEDYAMHLDGRIEAFANVQAVVTRNLSAGVALDMLVADTLLAVGAQEGERVRHIQGPPVRLQPKPAETFALALHELATNAVKYGALTTEQGRIAVEWHFKTVGEHPRLMFRWIETGVKLSGEKPARIGFGTELIERTLAYDLDGIARLNFTPDGLHCTINLPADGEILIEDRQPGRNS